MMKFKVGLAVGFGVGYVLGARAGRERYEEIAARFNELVERPEVQDIAAKGKAAFDFVAEAAKSRGNGSSGA
jgi:hypothetical protein